MQYMLEVLIVVYARFQSNGPPGFGRFPSVLGLHEPKPVSICLAPEP